MRRNWQLYAMLAVPLIWLAVFAYWPMYGAIIAFKDYNVVDGVLGSRWVGLKHFERFVESYQFWRLIKNTLTRPRCRSSVMRRRSGCSGR